MHCCGEEGNISHRDRVSASEVAKIDWTMHKEDLLRLGRAFRKAFETVGRSQSFGAFPHFPNGCCTWASIFIGNFLINEYDLSPKRVYSAWHPSSSQHEWVLLSGTIIDITADQFDDAPAPIIVRNDSEWHAQFRDSKISDYLPVSKYDIRGNTQKVSDIYELIISEVKELLT